MKKWLANLLLSIAVRLTDWATKLDPVPEEVLDRGWDNIKAALTTEPDDHWVVFRYGKDRELTIYQGTEGAVAALICDREEARSMRGALFKNGQQVRHWP